MSAFYSQLNHESLLQVSGPDAATFLQGQLTCDVRAIDAGNTRPAAWCNAQGRVIADFMVAQTEPEHYLLRLRATIAATTAERLAKYVVFSKASVTPADGWRVFACWGDDIASALRPRFASLPNQRHGCVNARGASLIQVDDNGQRFELYLAPDNDELLDALLSPLEPGQVDTWLGQQIDAGMGRIELTTVEEFLPQMLNYDLCGLVSFQKGCYTGQEVIARLHYRGKAKRRMFIGQVEVDALPAAGAPLYTPGAGQAVGNVVNAIAAEGHCRLLTSVALKSRAAPLHLDSSEGPLITLSEPDYLDLEDGSAADGE